MPKLHRSTLKETDARSRKTKWCSGAKQVANWQRSSCKPIIKKSKIHGIGPKAAASPIEVLSFTHLPRTPSILPSPPWCYNCMDPLQLNQCCNQTTTRTCDSAYDAGVSTTRGSEHNRLCWIQEKSVHLKVHTGTKAICRCSANIPVMRYS